MKTMIRMLLVAVFCCGINGSAAGISADITNCCPVAGGFMIEWAPAGSAVVKWSPDLAATPFTDLSAKLPATQGSYIDTVHGADNQCFYRVDLDAPEGMAFIPAGTFQMGDTFAEGYSDERPVHSVYVSGFYMDKYEVTKALWDEVYNWAISNGYAFDHAGSGKAANHPVHTVSWFDCVKWCNARSEMEGRTPCYTAGGVVYRTGQSAPDCDWNANGYRLPTEAEWEKAARGGLNGKRYGWGDSIDHSKANYGWDPDGVHSSPVGSFAPTGYGMYDMAGNMWEWCSDWYDAAYYATSPSSNPRGALTGSSRVRRGGGWFHDAADCRSAFRAGFVPWIAADDFGFRAAMPANP